VGSLTLEGAVGGSSDLRPNPIAEDEKGYNLARAVLRAMSAK